MASEGGGGKERSSGTHRTSGSSRKEGDFLRFGQVLAAGYEVMEQIGEGGMAIVYKATQKSLGRYVAIKALHPKFARDREFIARFEAESGALAALSHPNIVSIIDRGVEGEVYYFVMEYVDGANLDVRIIENKLTPNDWRQVIAACSSALDYVHKRGVVHRDIKPSNVLIDSEGRVKLGDFGIAHIMGGDSQGPVRAVGTAHYMAPEQTHDPGNVDHRADIYGLGVALYKMLTRQLPIGEFPAPSEANRDVPVAVDAVIFQAMAPNRDDRYQSVTSFCDDLQKALREQALNVASILNYRSPTGGASSLYTGDHFKSNKTPVPTSNSGEVKRLKIDPGTKSKTGTSTGTGTGTGSGARRSATPVPVSEGGKGAAGRVLTPVPVKPGSGVAPAAATTPESGGNRLVPVLIGGIALALLAGLGVAAFLMSGESGNRRRTQPTATPTETPAPTPVRSSAREREEREREERERRQREILQKESEPQVSPIFQPAPAGENPAATPAVQAPEAGLATPIPATPVQPMVTPEAPFDAPR